MEITTRGMTKAKTVQNRNKVKTETRGLKTLQKIKFIIESLTWIPGQPTKATKRVNPKKKPNLKQFKILVRLGSIFLDFSRNIFHCQTVANTKC